MSNQRYTSRAIMMPIYMLTAAENEYPRNNEVLMREIRKLRGEVGIIAKRYNQAKREIKNLIMKIQSQPPPVIPERMRESRGNKEGEAEGIVMMEARGESRGSDEESSEKVAEEEKMETTGEGEKETACPPSESPPLPLPSPSPSLPEDHVTNIPQALNIIRKEPLPMAKDETTLAAERAIGRHDKWDRAVRRFYKERGNHVGEFYAGYKGEREMCTAIGQWSIDRFKTELTIFDYWGWLCVKEHEKKGMEEVGKAWLTTSERVKRIKMVNKVYRE